jgi:dTDP-4-amino-4,6-dideoxygalactose transaminase
MKIPLIDLVAQYRTIESEIQEAVRQVLESGQFILGPNVAAFEEEVAAYLGVAHGVGVGSGTDALVLALRALEIGPGHEVIVPAYSFFASAEAVMLVGAKPVFVDIHAESYGLNVSQVAERITASTKAIVPVHLYGQPADLGPLLELARGRKLRIIEDNAQAFGSEYDGRKTGSFGDVACLSFFPSKNLGAYGDGGMVVSNDAAVAERVRMLRTHGWRKKYFPEVLGYNSRLDELHAAMLRVKLHHVDSWNERRRQLAHRLTEGLAGLPVGVPRELPRAKHVYHMYMVRVQNRDRVQQHLKAKGIASAVYYPVPLHLTIPCRSLGYQRGDFPVAESASQETLALPLYPEMGDREVEEIVREMALAVGQDRNRS